MRISCKFGFEHHGICHDWARHRSGECRFPRDRLEYQNISATLLGWLGLYGPRRRNRILKYTSDEMASYLLRPAAHAELLRKVFDLSGRGLSKPLAESILSLDFPESDAYRAAELNARANEGTLTEAERGELEAYADIADLLAYWQVKARQALQQM